MRGNSGSSSSVSYDDCAPAWAAAGGGGGGGGVARSRARAAPLVGGKAAAAVADSGYDPSSDPVTALRLIDVLTSIADACYGADAADGSGPEGRCAHKSQQVDGQQTGAGGGAPREGACDQGAAAAAAAVAAAPGGGGRRALEMSLAVADARARMPARPAAVCTNSCAPRRRSRRGLAAVCRECGHGAAADPQLLPPRPAGGGGAPGGGAAEAEARAAAARALREAADAAAAAGLPCHPFPARVLLAWHEDTLLHRGMLPPHPERPERLHAALARLRAAGLLGGCSWACCHGRAWWGCRLPPA